MILFLGCSLTWGQGLQIEKWISEGKDIEFCNKNSVPDYNAEYLSYEDDEYRKKHHFPNLVAKHFDKSYATKWGNGGANDANLEFLEKYIHYLTNEKTVELIVIQFTDLSRDRLFNYLYKKNLYDLAEFQAKQNISVMDKICNEELSHREDSIVGIPWIGISWHKEHSSFMKERYKKNFVPIFYKDKEFNDISTLNQYVKDKVGIENWPKENAFELCDKYDGVNDGHPTIEWHKVIADSIIRKIKKENIQFKRYNN